MEGVQSHQLYRSLLKRLKDGPDVLVEGEHITVLEVFERTLLMLLSRDFCPCHVLKMLQVAARAVTVKYTGVNDLWVIDNLTYLGVLTMEVVCRYVSYTDRPLSGRWTRVTVFAASLVSHWRPELFKKKPRQTEYLKSWTSLMMESPTECPNPALRLEMLRFVAMWEREDLLDAELANDTVVAVMETCNDLTLSRLLPKGRIGLVCPLRKVLYHFSGLLGGLLRRSPARIRHLLVGQVERSVTFLVVLMGQAARRTLYMQRSRHLTHYEAVEQQLSIIQILRLLVATRPNQELFEEAGMCQIAATAIAKTCRSIVQTPRTLETQEPFKNLLREVHNLFMNLAMFQTKDTVTKELQRYHGRCLSFVATKMRMFGYPVPRIPEPLEEEETQAPPKRFLDSKTGRLMESPVRMLLSGQMVDRSTLLLLKLATAVDPQTERPVHNLGYEPMTSLQQEIRAWKDQQQHN